MDIATQIKEKILQLEEALLAQHPSMPTLLQEIHANLRANPDVVTLLTEPEIGTIVNGLSKQTQTSIATAALKSRTKSVKSLTLADL